MVFNEVASPYSGIIQNLERETKLGLGTISGNAAPDYWLTYFLGKVNEWLHIINQWIREVNDEWIHDDVNNTGTIPEEFDFSDDTQIYDLDSDIVKVRKVQVHNIVSASKTFTVTIATPAVFSLTNHGLVLGDIVNFTTSGALPTGLTVGTNYYVITAGLTANAFEVSTSSGGAAVNTSGTQSGIHTVIIHKIGWVDLDYNYLTDREDDIYGQSAGIPSSYFFQGRQIIFDVPADIVKVDRYRLFYDRHAHEFVIGDITAVPGFDKQFHYALVYGATMDWAAGRYSDIYNYCRAKLFGTGEGDPISLKFMIQQHYQKQNRDMKYIIGRQTKSYS